MFLLPGPRFANPKDSANALEEGSRDAVCSGTWLLKTLTQCSLLGTCLARFVCKLLEGPFRVFRHHRIWFLGQRLQIRYEILVAAVAHGDGHITLQPGIFGPLYRRAAKRPT